MKQVVSLVIILFICTAMKAEKFSIGVESGIVSSKNTKYKFTEIENRRNTYYIGLNANYKLNKKIELTTGIHFLRQGYKRTTCYIFEEGVKNELVGKLNYQIVPVLFNLYIGKTNKFWTSIGIYNGLNGKAAQDYPKQIGGCLKGYPKDISSSTKKYVVGGIIGLGYHFFEKDNFQLSSRIKYFQGINNIKKNPYSSLNFWNDKYSSLLISFALNYNI